MWRLMSAAVRASTSSRSSDEFTSSPISASVARTSAEISGVPLGAAVSICVSVGFIWKNYYSRPANVCWQTPAKAARFAAPLGAESRASFLDQLHAGAGPNPRSAGFHHLQQLIQRTHAARGFHANFRTHHPPHQLDVLNGRAARTKPSRSLHKICSSFDRQLAGSFLFFA